MRGRHVVPLFLALALQCGADAAQVAVVWDGGAGTSNWEDANNWNPNVVPNNGVPAGTTYAVTIDDGSAGTGFTVNLNFSVTIDTLTIGAGDSLFVNQGTAFDIAGSAIVNAGTLLLNSAGGTTELGIFGAVVTLSGGGALMMSNSINNRILGGSSTNRLVNIDNTISGAGQIGLNAMALTNQGTITATLPAGIVLDPSSSGAINSGTIQATNSSSLTLQGATVNNTGGLIRVDSAGGNSLVQVVSSSTVTGGTVDLTGAGNGELRLSSSSITGGSVTNNATGIIRAQSGTNTLSGAVTNPVGGQVIIGNLATLVFNVSGTYSNSGSIALLSTGSATQLKVGGGNVTLTGGGTVTMSNNINNRITGVASTDRLVNADNTISGAGQIGINFMALTNQGTIDASLPTGITVVPSASGASNTGTMRATLGSSLNLSAGAFDNTGGLVRCDSSGGSSVVQVISSTVTGGTADLVGAGNCELRLRSGSITGGTVTNNTTGIVRAQMGTNTLGGAVTNPAGGQIAIDDAATLGFLDGSSYANAGNIALSSSGTPTSLTVSGATVTLSGGGTVTMSNNIQNQIRGASSGNERLVNANNTISGTGQIGVNFMAFTNQGVVNASQSSGIIVDPGASGAVNTGTLRATLGSTLTLTAGAFDNTGGLIRCDSTAGSSAVQVNSSTSVTGGTVDLVGVGNGELRLNASTITGATVTNNATGTIRAQSGTNVLGSTVTNPAGGVIVVPNSSVLQGAGTWTNAGTVQVDAGGVLNHPLGYTQSVGITHLNGSMIGGGSIALQGGVLDGGGATTGNVSNTGGVIAPGTSPGILGTGDVSFSAASSFSVELNGMTVGTQYDQLNVTGTVSLGNAALNVAVGSSPMNGQTFTIINNDASDAISGTFAGLPQGASFIAGGSGFTISYTGGSGNDVVLTAVPCTSLDTTAPGVTPPSALTTTQTLCM